MIRQAHMEGLMRCQISFSQNSCEECCSSFWRMKQLEQLLTQSSLGQHFKQSQLQEALKENNTANNLYCLQLWF